MDAGIIIFSRLDSSRLPGKSIVDLCGRPLLARVIERAKRVNKLSPVIVATSDRGIDDPIEQLAKTEGVHVYRGDLHDVASRGLSCAEAYNLEYFARVCGDRPFFDPKLIDLYYQRARETSSDLVTNALTKTFPPGLTTEIVRSAALKQALRQTDSDEDREHMTRCFYKRPGDFNILSYSNAENWMDVSLVVDTKVDLDRAVYIQSRLNTLKGEEDTSKIVRFAREWYRERGAEG